MTADQSLIQNIDEALCREEILDKGYAVRHDVVSASDVRAMRDYWIETFRTRSEERPMIWGPYYGEENRIIHDRSDALELYRSFDFLWNSPIDSLTRNVGVALSRMRNRIAEYDERHGEYFSADEFGIYITTSLYPADTGWMEEHRDQIYPGKRHWHFILPLTFKGEDYETGGLFLEDRSGTRVDVDADLVPGSVVFFDGAQPHGVAKIGPSENGAGRLQMFAIPTLFGPPHSHNRLLEQVSVKRYVKSRLRQFIKGTAG